MVEGSRNQQDLEIGNKKGAVLISELKLSDSFVKDSNEYKTLDLLFSCGYNSS